MENTLRLASSMDRTLENNRTDISRTSPSSAIQMIKDDAHRSSAMSNRDYLRGEVSTCSAYYNPIVVDVLFHTSSVASLETRWHVAQRIKPEDAADQRNTEWTHTIDHSWRETLPSYQDENISQFLIIYVIRYKGSRSIICQNKLKQAVRYSKSCIKPCKTSHWCKHKIKCYMSASALFYSLIRLTSQWSSQKMPIHHETMKKVVLQ